MAEPENTVEAREESMRVQLAGPVTAEEAAAGLAAAKRELAQGRGSGHSLAFGYVKNFGSPRGLDGVRLEYAITDGERVANVHTIISGTRLSMLGYERTTEPGEGLLSWALDQLYQQAGSIPLSHDRYATLLARHPLRLG